MLAMVIESELLTLSMDQRQRRHARQPPLAPPSAGHTPGTASPLSTGGGCVGGGWRRWRERSFEGHQFARQNSNRLAGGATGDGRRASAGRLRGRLRDGQRCWCCAGRRSYAQQHRQQYLMPEAH